MEFLSRYEHIPMVTINFRAPFGNAILTHSKQGFEALMQHLIETHGYRKLAFVKGPEYNPDALNRKRRYGLFQYRAPIRIPAAAIRIWIMFFTSILPLSTI